MGAKSYLFIILVALTVGFALIPAAQAENGIEITSMQHDNARIENSIDLELVPPRCKLNSLLRKTQSVLLGCPH